MRWLYALVLSLLPVTAFAQCGPDTAPTQAAAQGYTCETYRWTCGGGGTGCASGSGDTISEIDTAQTYNPGFKLYYGTVHNNGHTTVGSDFTVDVNGKIVIQTTETCPGPACGAFSLNTCGANSSFGSGQYQVGTFFSNGWYLEFIGEWNATGHTNVQSGLYGLANTNATFPLGGTLLWEVDNPDSFADDQNINYWGGGTPQGQPNSGWTSHVNTVETGTTKFGAMSTATNFTWWANNVANGSVAFLGFGETAADLFTRAFCFGMESTSTYPVKLDGLRVWQATPPPPPIFGGNSGTLRRR